MKVKKFWTFVLKAIENTANRVSAQSPACIENIAIGDKFKGDVVYVNKKYALVRSGSVTGKLNLADYEHDHDIKDLRKCVNVGDVLDLVVLWKQDEFDIVALSSASREEAFEKFLTTKVPGSLVSGRVIQTWKNIALVDLGMGVRGAVSTKELSWTTRPETTADVLTVGETHSFVVTAIDAVQQKVCLSFREAQENPWFEIEANYPVGSTVSGVVIGNYTFGTLVKVDDAFSALLKEIRKSDTEGVNMDYLPGCRIKALVYGVYPKRARMTLKLAA